MKRKPALLQASLALLCLAGNSFRLQAQVMVNGYVYVDSGSVVSIHDNLYYGSNAYQVIADGARLEFKGNMLSVAAGAVLQQDYTGLNPQVNGKLVFNSPMHQVLATDLSNPGTPAVGNLLLDNPDGLTLAQGTDLRINGSLEFSQGYLSAGTSNVTFAGNATTSGAGPGKAIVLAPAGRVTREALASQASFVFPVAAFPADYAPAILSNDGSGADNFTVGVATYDQLPSGLIGVPETGMGRAWNISSVYGNGAAVSLEHNVSANGSSYNDATAYVSRYDGVSWQDCNGCAMTYTSGSFPGYALHTRTYTSVPNSGPDNWFTKLTGSSNPLPVELGAWSAECVRDGVLLQWTTLSEYNNSYFTVYRSADARSWNVLGQVPAGKEEGRHYRFLDKEGAGYYYRLQQTDIDGTSVFVTETLSTSCDLKDKWAVRVYPNPAADNVMLEGNAGEAYTLSVYDAGGRSVLRQELSSAGYKLDVTQWTPGVYLFRMQSAGGKVQTLRFVKFNR